MLMFSQTVIESFRKKNPALRYGQEFHQFMQLDKIENPADKEFCDRLYEADGEKAIAMIRERTDRTQ